MVDKLVPPANLKIIIAILEKLLESGVTMEDFRQAFNWIDWKETSVQKNWFGVEP